MVSGLGDNMQTMELGYISSEGTHFLFTPNLFGLPVTQPTGAPDKKIFVLAFSKSWDTCKLQAQEQLHDLLGGTWVYGNDSHGPQDIPDMDMAAAYNDAPKMKLLQMAT